MNSSSLKNYRIPGVFIDSETQQIQPISLSDRCVAGMIGLAEKGPLHMPVKVHNFHEFRKIFGGFTEYAYLAYSVYGFFNSGGAECVVVRTAHESENDSENSTAKASLVLFDNDLVPCYEITALSEGTWGNLTEIRIWYKTKVTAFVTKRSEESDWQEWLDVDLVEGFSTGDNVCIVKNEFKEYAKIARIENNRVHLNRKLDLPMDPSRDEVSISNIIVNIVINNSKERVFEEYISLTPDKSDENNIVKAINSRSALVAIKEIREGGMPKESSFINLKSGRNGVLGISPADFIGYFKGLGDAKGLGIFESVEEISLLAAPDLLVFEELVEKDKKKAMDQIFAVQRAMIDQCERMERRFALLDCPAMDDFLLMSAWRKRFDTQVAAMYYPKMEMINPDDDTALTSIMVPPSGHIAGVYALCDAKFGIHKAPANEFIKGAVGVERFIEDEEYEVTYPMGLNCLQYVPGRGTRIWGARTLSSDVSWRFINVRRTFSAIKGALRSGTGWAVFEPNDPSLRKRIVRHVNAFLLDLWKKGYMAGVEPEDGYYIRCDDELNPPEDIDSGRITVEVGLAIARPAEFLVITLKADGENGLILFDE